MGRKTLGMVLAIAMGWSVGASAAKLQSYSGTVTRIGAGEIELSRGEESRVFGWDDLDPAERKSLALGDEVTLWYSLEAKRIRSGGDRQQPGQRGETGLEIEDLPSPAIQDDRAFYNARNEKSISRGDSSEQS